MPKIDTAIIEQEEFHRELIATNPLNKHNDDNDYNHPEMFGFNLKKVPSSKLLRVGGGQPIKHLLDQGNQFHDIDRSVRPVARNISKVLADYLGVHRNESYSEPLNVMELELGNSKLKVRAIPSNDPNKKGRLNAIEVNGLGKESRKYRLINPSIIPKIHRPAYINKLRRHNGLIEDLPLKEQQNEKWIQYLEQGKDINLWIPVNPETNEYLIDELDLTSEIREFSTNTLKTSQAHSFKKRYGEENPGGEALLWAEIAKQELIAFRIRNAIQSLNTKHNDINEPTLIPEFDKQGNPIEGHTSSYIVPDSEVKDDESIIITHDHIMQTGYEYDEKKKEKQDYIWVGRNRAGLRAFALYDGVSNVGDRKDGEPFINRSGNLAKFMGNAVRKTRSGSLHELRRVADDALHSFTEVQYKDERAAATGVAAVIDENNNLRGHMRGDVAVYVYRNGQIERVSPIQNEKTDKLYEIMEKRKITKAEAKVVLKNEFPDIKNSPNMYRSNKPNDNRGFEFNVKLKKGDVVMFFSDGVFDHTQTKRAENQLLIEAANSNNPAEYLINEANRLHGQYNPGGHKDDYSAGFMRI